jgi:cell division septation protein DedD
LKTRKKEKVTDYLTPEPAGEAEEVVVIDEIPNSGLMTDPETGWLKPTDETAPEEPTEEPAEEVEAENEEQKKGYLWLIIMLGAIIIAALLYFCVFDKDDDAQEEKIEEVQPEIIPEPEPEPEPVKEPEPEPEPQATVYTISAPDGRFYVIVGSFYDVDLAEDKANEIVGMGMDAFMLEPVEGFIFHRVAVKVTERQSEAFGALGGLKPEFGDDIWVVKF